MNLEICSLLFFCLHHCLHKEPRVLIGNRCSFRSDENGRTVSIEVMRQKVSCNESLTWGLLLGELGTEETGCERLGSGEISSKQFCRQGLREVGGRHSQSQGVMFIALFLTVTTLRAFPGGSSRTHLRHQSSPAFPPPILLQFLRNHFTLLWKKCPQENKINSWEQNLR